ncbi:MAG: hypothetical protein OXH27_09950 [Gammaproteobacteria bacterium]|nr:hypothetical protein [Gammaproteobacteria bacterium]
MLGNAESKSCLTRRNDYDYYYRAFSVAPGLLLLASSSPKTEKSASEAARDRSDVMHK